MKLAVMKTKENKVGAMLKEDPQACIFKPDPCAEHIFKMQQGAFLWNKRAIAQWSHIMMHM